MHSLPALQLMSVPVTGPGKAGAVKSQTAGLSFGVGQFITFSTCAYSVLCSALHCLYPAGCDALACMQTP